MRRRLGLSPSHCSLNTSGDTADSVVDASFNLDALYAARGGLKLSAQPIVIAPHEELRFGPVTFQPHLRTGTHEAMLLLKNNLTLFQPVSLVGEGGTAVVRLLDAAQLPIPYHIALNRSIDPLLYRMRASNVGPPLRTHKGTVDSEGKVIALVCVFLVVLKRATRGCRWLFSCSPNTLQRAQPEALQQRQPLPALRPLWLRQRPSST